MNLRKNVLVNTLQVMISRRHVQPLVCVIEETSCAREQIIKDAKTEVH